MKEVFAFVANFIDQPSRICKHCFVFTPYLPCGELVTNTAQKEEMASRGVDEKVNQGFVIEASGYELKSTAVSVPDQAVGSRENGSNNKLLKLAVVLIVILIVGIVLIGVYYAKEVKDNDDDVHKRPTTTKTPARSTIIPPCVDESCIHNAAGKEGKQKFPLLENFRIIPDISWVYFIIAFASC